MGEDAIVENSVRLNELVGVEDTAEAAALNNTNFIRVMIGNESCLARSWGLDIASGLTNSD